jgi:hypothetical protein
VRASADGRRRLRRRSFPGRRRRPRSRAAAPPGARRRRPTRSRNRSVHRRFAQNVERLWSLAGATGGNRSQMRWSQNGSTRPIGNRWQPTATVSERMVRNAMKKGLPRSDAPRVLERRREARCNVVRRFGSQSQASRLPPARRGGRDGRRRRVAARRRRSSWSDAAARASWRSDPRSNRIDERRALRARPARASRLASRETTCSSTEAATATARPRPARSSPASSRGR